MNLHNIKEDFVEKALEDILANYDCCKCTKCQMDMMALALNKLRPHYVVTQQGQAMTTNMYLSTHGQAEILSETVKAVEFVSKNPRHVKDWGEEMTDQEVESSSAENTSKLIREESGPIDLAEAALEQRVEAALGDIEF
ncbi:late competence development ComFB family protein [Oscillospiraceae bacterium OttesenSCG-928-F05]|nr:late competence development ComFB family protein [Oscillospiraceae bacterium OttesenSCG-928-F05]